MRSPQLFREPARNFNTSGVPTDNAIFTTLFGADGAVASTDAATRKWSRNCPSIHFGLNNYLSFIIGKSKIGIFLAKNSQSRNNWTEIKIWTERKSSQISPRQYHRMHDEGGFRDFWPERRFKIAREARKVACHAIASCDSPPRLFFFPAERALRDGEGSIGRKGARDRGYGERGRGRGRNKGDAFSLTGLHRDFTAEHFADAIRRLAPIDGRVYVVPVALRAERQEVHGAVHQHLTDVRYRQDRRAVAHQPVDPRRGTAVSRAVDHRPGVVRELHARARLRDQHRPLAVQHHSSSCNRESEASEKSGLPRERTRARTELRRGRF